MNLEKIGELIKEKRQEKNLTQEELANLLFVSNKTVSKWERGKGLPSIELLMPICKALDIELKELLSGKKDSTYEELLIKELKNKRISRITKLIGGIIICLCLCALEAIIAISKIDLKYGYLIFGIIIFILLLVDICDYFIHKK